MSRLPLAAALTAALVLPAAAQNAPAPGTAPPVAPGAARLAPVETPVGQVTALIDLGTEFPALKGYNFTQSYTVIPPGTGRAMHSHAAFPEIVRVLQGGQTDSRNGGPPLPHGPGSTMINTSGVTHMWANLAKQPVVFVNTTIRAQRPGDQPPTVLPALPPTPPSAARLAPGETPPGKFEAMLDLGLEFPAGKGYVMLQSLTIVAPGTGRALHSHAGAPEIVRVLHGTLTDSRNGGPPVAYPAGSTILNTGGVTHMWANLGTETTITLNTAVRLRKPEDVITPVPPVK